MNKAKRYSPEVRQRAVRMVFEHQSEYASQWAAMGSIAGKIGCTPETLRSWVHQSERDQGGVTRDERERLKALERENRELKRANEILRKASAYFAHRASTAAASKTLVYRCKPRGLWGRADLPGAGNRSIDLLRA